MGRTEQARTASEQRLVDINSKLESWNHFVRALNVPSELIPAFASGRLELMKAARARPLSQEECQVMFDLVGGLLETNAVLREHAQAVADGAQIIAGSLKGALGAADRLRRLAEFTNVGVDDEDEDE